ncbi:MAG: 4-deoxy-4-formamido-L-arabinose-phosphoundecaprenol deformylase [Nitrospirae bacterium]|nr:MAG: 4-deoxy-4-formamido-L-arabinose-phosphoundecaprenol deformylase [Nitrospirota bacterium]
MSSERYLSLKIDVDTHDGMKKGVPKLLKVLDEFGIYATFCLSFGPDNAGKALFRMIREPMFLKKMLKTRAPRLYGFRTIFSGTLLPARPIATAFPELVRQIDEQGHEVIVHAWNHRAWQDHLQDFSRDMILAEFDRAFQAFEEILGRAPMAVAAPGWQASLQSLEVQDTLNLLYASDLRESPPCFIRNNNKIFKTLQIPTTGPCIEELLAIGIRDEEKMANTIIEELSKYDYPVLAVHAEVEGGPFIVFFEKLLGKLLKRFKSIVPLHTVAEHLLMKRDTIPVGDLTFITIPGRAGKVASSKAVCIE